MRKTARILCLALAFMLLIPLAYAEDLGVIHRQNFGTNATVLPLVGEDDPPVTISIWRGFNSTVMEGLDECLVFQEMEKRTGVKIEWMYPPVGQETDNYNLRIASNDLPHMFSMPPEYPGGLEKAIDDEIYLPITEYYNNGFTPNYKFLRETYPQIAADTVLDSGELVAWHMLDYVPSSPWTGLWVRQDWLEELGIALPETMDDWDQMLRKLKEEKGAVLGLNIRDSNGWYGVGTNFAFAAGFETGYNWINKDGKAEYGPANEGYKEFVTLLHKWYQDGLIDPDFATRANDDYFANVANGVYGAFGLAYGELGQAKVSGLAKDPKFQLLAVRQPTSYEGQEIKLRQYDSIVRTDREYLTTRCADEGIDELAMMWKDYWYSQEGGDLCSYGVEGVSYKWNEKDELEWIYEETGIIQRGDTLDFWTVYPLFKLHNWGYLRDSTSYDNQPEVWQCINEWSKDGASWYMPDAISLTAEESEEFSRIEVNLKTYREEMTYKFITGQESLEKFDEYVAALEGMDLETAVEIKQAGLDRFLAR